MRNPATRARRLVRTLVAVATVGLMTSTGAAYAYVNGADTSNYQHNPSLNWKSVAADGVKFAFLKATEGSTFTDPYFKADWTASANAGIYRGAYHFARPSKGTALKQADYFVSTIGPQNGRGTLPPVLDLEVTGGLGPSALITWVRTFLQEVQAKTGRNPIIYVSPYFWIDNMNNTTAFSSTYPLWIANYGVKNPMVPGGWSTWSFWQTTSSGRIQGISGNVDKDVFNGTMTQLQKFALAYSKPATTTTLTASNTAPTIGQSVTFRGTSATTDGTAVAGSRVVLQSQPAGSTTWTTVRRLTTGKGGGFSTSLVINAPADYRARLVRTDSYRPSTSPVVPVTLTPLATTLSLGTPAAALDAGASLSLSGTLEQSGQPVTGRNVSIFSRPDGSTTWSRIAIVSTDDSGAFQMVRTAKQTATYRARYPGETGYSASGAAVGPVTVTPNPTALSLGLSNDAPYKGQGFSVRGTLTSNGNAVSGYRVTVQRQLAGSNTWTTLGTPRTDSSGRYALSQTADVPATYRAAYAGRWRYQSVTADPVDLTITPPAATRLQMTASRSTIRSGRSSTLKALLTSHGAGIARSVQLFQRHAGQTHWHFIYKTSTRLPDGDCRIVVSPTQTTWYQLRFHGGNRLAASQHTLKVSVS